MLADFHLARVDGTERRKYAERHQELVKFVARDRDESCVLRCGGARRLKYSMVQWENGGHISDTAPQLSLEIESGEYSAELR
jgi:hypothetical protein